MAVTMKNIAEHCGVSEGAVSQVLRNPEHPRFSEATRQLIRDTAARLDYRQNRLSLALSSKKTNMIGLMLPWNEPEIMDNVEHRVSEKGYKLMLQFTGQPRAGVELEALRSFIDWNVDGIIWEPSGVTRDDFLPVLNMIRRKGPPLVMLERGIDGFDFPVIKTDYAPVFKDCIAHLVRQQYTRTAFVSAQLEAVQDICRMLEKETKKQGLEFEVVQLDEFQRKQTLVEQCRRVLRRPATPDTAFICHSWNAADMLKAAARENYRVPQDIGLAMVQDLLLAGRLYVSSFFTPEVTSCRVNGAELVENAVDSLFAGIEKPGGKPASVSIRADFTIRESTNRYHKPQ